MARIREMGRIMVPPATRELHESMSPADEAKKFLLPPGIDGPLTDLKTQIAAARRTSDPAVVAGAFDAMDTFLAWLDAQQGEDEQAERSAGEELEEAMRDEESYQRMTRARRDDEESTHECEACGAQPTTLRCEACGGVLRPRRDEETQDDEAGALVHDESGRRPLHLKTEAARSFVIAMDQQGSSPFRPHRPLRETRVQVAASAADAFRRSMRIGRAH